MVLIDKKILSGGIAMIIAGIILTVAISESPAGQPGMTEEEIIDLMIAEDENQAFDNSLNLWQSANEFGKISKY